VSDVVMALIARVYRSDHDERRGAVRYPIEIDATLRGPEGEPIDALIYDLSLIGFRMETSAALELDEAISIGIAGTRVNASVVARRGPSGYGCEFVIPITLAQLKSALNPEQTVHELGRREKDLDWSDDNDRGPDSTIAEYRLAFWLLVIFGSALGLAVLFLLLRLF